MPHDEYRARSSGGYVRVCRFEDGVKTGDGIAVTNRRFADLLARHLNEAYERGVAHGRQEGRKEGRDHVADLLDSKASQIEHREVRDGWEAAAREARQHPI